MFNEEATNKITKGYSSRENSDYNIENIYIENGFIEMEDNCWCAVRPSGTEPKIKFYMGASGRSVDEAENVLKNMWEDLERYTK